MYEYITYDNCPRVWRIGFDNHERNDGSGWEVDNQWRDDALRAHCDPLSIYIGTDLGRFTSPLELALLQPTLRAYD